MVIASIVLESLVNSPGCVPRFSLSCPRLPLAIGKREFTSTPTISSTGVCDYAVSPFTNCSARSLSFAAPL